MLFLNSIHLWTLQLDNTDVIKIKIVFFQQSSSTKNFPYKPRKTNQTNDSFISYKGYNFGSKLKVKSFNF